MLEILNVSGKSSTKELANLIWQRLDAQGVAVLRAIGAGAVNQMTKGVAVAEQQGEGKKLVVHLTFFNTMFGEQEKSGIQMEVKGEN